MARLGQLTFQVHTVYSILMIPAMKISAGHPKEITANRVGKNIKRFATAHGLGVVSLAEKCELPKSYISAVINGKLMPSAPRLYLIAKRLGTTCEKILTD